MGLVGIDPHPEPDKLVFTEIDLLVPLLPLVHCHAERAQHNTGWALYSTLKTLHKHWLSFNNRGELLAGSPSGRAYLTSKQFRIDLSSCGILDNCEGEQDLLATKKRVHNAILLESSLCSCPHTATQNSYDRSVTCITAVDHGSHNRFITEVKNKVILELLLGAIGRYERGEEARD